MIKVRTAQPRDFDRLLALFDEVAAERQWIGTEPGFDKEKYRAAWQDIAAGKGGAHFVACHENEIVGALSLYPTINDHHDLGVLVSPKHRAQGIGTALMRAASGWAQAHDIPKLTLGVFPHNTIAISLYEKFGFVTVRRLARKMARQTGDMWDVIIMEKPIRPFDSSLQIETERLVLRSPTLDDAQDLVHAYTSDPHVTRFLPFLPYDDVSQARKFLQSRLTHIRDGRSLYWLIVPREASAPIGAVEVRVTDDVGDVGYVIGKRWWGQGIVPEALRAVIDFGRERLGLRRFTGMCDYENLQSARVFEKCGFTRVGIEDAAVVHPALGSEPRPVVLFAIDFGGEPVTLAPYDTCWPAIFEHEAISLRKSLGRFGLLGLEHVGSTAISGMTAKPIIDIVAGIAEMERLPVPSDPMWAALGYEWGHGTEKPDEWLYFVKRDATGRRIFQLHVVPFQGEFWHRIIAFRDSLRENAALANAYQALKTRLAATHGNDRLRYRDKKAAFVADVVAQRTTPRPIDP